MRQSNKILAATAAAISSLLALGWYSAPCSAFQTPTARPAAGDRGFDSCPPPNPSLQALAGDNRYALRACVVCPMVAAPRAPRPFNPATNAVEYYYQQSAASRYSTALRSEASGLVRITYVSQMGDESDLQWLQPGEEYRALMPPGAWLRAYAATGELLLEHHVGLTPILSAEALGADVSLNSTGYISPRPVPPKGSKGWKSRSKSFDLQRFLNRGGDSRPLSDRDSVVTVGFLNIAGHGVDVLSHSSGGKVPELADMIPDEESRLHHASIGHKFDLVDEAGRALGKSFVVEDIVVRDCNENRQARLAVASLPGLGQELASGVPSLTFGSIGLKQ